MDAKDLKVFNPTVGLAHPDDDDEIDNTVQDKLEDAIKNSRIIIAALSQHGFFASKWCRKEIEAARVNKIMVIPVYSGDAHGANQVDKWVEEFKNDSTFKHIFEKNARDVLNKQNPESTKKTLRLLAKLAK